MKLTKKSFILTVSPFLIGSGILCLITSLATSDWLVVEFKYAYGQTHIGLFQVCSMGHCMVYDDHSRIKISVDLKVIRGLCITAVILYGFCFLVMVHFGLKYKKIVSRKHTIICLISCILAASLNIAGVGHYVKDHEDTEFSKEMTHQYGYSLHLAWASSLLVLLGGLVSYPVVNHFFKKREMVNRAFVAQVPPPAYSEVFSTHQNGISSHVTVPAPDYNSLYAMDNLAVTGDNPDEHAATAMEEKPKLDDAKNPGF